MAEEENGSGGERRRGALETAQALGALQATVQSLLQQQAERHAENIARHTETIALVGEVQGRVRDLTHSHNNERVVVAGLAAEVKAHQATLEAHNVAATNALNLVRQEVVANRTVATNRMDQMGDRIEDLVSFKYRLVGAGTLAGMAVTILAGSLGLGKALWGAVEKAWHAVTGQ